MIGLALHLQVIESLYPLVNEYFCSMEIAEESDRLPFLLLRAALPSGVCHGGKSTFVESESDPVWVVAWHFLPEWWTPEEFKTQRYLDILRPRFAPGWHRVRGWYRLNKIRLTPGAEKGLSLIGYRVGNPWSILVTTVIPRQNPKDSTSSSSSSS